MSWHYRYCGFKINSTLEFPELEPDEADGQEASISIEQASFGIPRTTSLHFGPNWAVGPQQSFWWLDGIARFRITADSIEIDAERSAPDGLLRALALEAPFILAMQYREAFCLTVSAVADGKTVQAFRFLSGGGSSTAAAWQVVRGRGRTLFSDTLLRISVDDSGKPIAWPQGSGVLLWPKARKLLELDAHPMLEVRPELPVRRVWIDSAQRPLPLEIIYTAAIHRRLEESMQEDAHLMQARRPFRLAALRTAGRLWIDPMGKTEKHFRWCLSIARHCKIEKGILSNLYPGC